MDYLERAYELTEEIVENRRFLHQHPEIGCDIPVTKVFVEDKLKCMRYGVVHVDPGLVAMAGHESPTILLCANMGGLLMGEESGLPFASVSPGKAHRCGHDSHIAILLGAAKMLKENEADLKGTVELMFQPGEETGNDAQEMINGGLLENPRPDVTMAFHVDIPLPLGKLNYSKGPTFCSNDVSKIEVMGKADHGACPHQAMDATNASAHIITGLEALISRERTPTEICILTVCSTESDTRTFNVFPQAVIMAGSIRTYNTGQRALLVRRLQEAVDGISKTFNCTSKVTLGHQNDPLIVDDQVEIEIQSYLEEVLGDEASVVEPSIMKTGSEDFASITAQIPSAYFYIGAEPDQENGYFCSQHNAKIRFSEETLPYGVVGSANCVARWLENHSK